MSPGPNFISTETMSWSPDSDMAHGNQMAHIIWAIFWHMVSYHWYVTYWNEFLARHSFHFFPQNNKDAEAYWIQAANDGDGSVTAMVDLGKYYFTNEHYKDSFYWYQCATGRGDAHAQACIGTNFNK